MKLLSLLLIFTLSFSFGCASPKEDIVEEQREELGIEDEGFYSDEGPHDDPDEVYESPELN